MKISILTLFPSMFKGPFDTSMLKKAQDIGALEVEIKDIRDWATDKHKQVDDRPFGGGPGMVLKVEPIFNALQDLKQDNTHVVLLSPQGDTFNQKKAKQLSEKYGHIILIAGHYEGFDERIRENLIDEQISVGEYVLTGGEIPAMIITDSVARLLPGVLEPEAKEAESFSDGETLDYPQYTRPQNFNGWEVPEILLTGDHKKIEAYRKAKQNDKTSKK